MVVELEIDLSVVMLLVFILKTKRAITRTSLLPNPIYEITSIPLSSSLRVFNRHPNYSLIDQRRVEFSIPGI